MKTPTLAVLLLGLTAPGIGAAEPEWDKKKAAARLDERARWWMETGTAQRATDANGKSACLSCHITVPYALARPALAKALASDATSLERLLKDVDRRGVAWPTVTEMYASNPVKKKESRGTEAVLNALVLAWNDAGSPAPSAATTRALEHLWETQRADGGWDWLRFPLEPWETKDAEYFGVALAALAIGSAPGYTANLDATLEKKVEALRTYLKDRRDRENLHAEAWLLLASTRLPGMLTPAEQSEVIGSLQARQWTEGDDAGGWVLLELAKWRYGGAAPPKTAPALNARARKPDGYATGLVAFALQRAGVKADDAKVAAALAWLRKSQLADGSWPAVSINRDRPAGDFAESFMSDAATAWAALALLEAEPRDARPFIPAKK